MIVNNCIKSIRSGFLILLLLVLVNPTYGSIASPPGFPKLMRPEINLRPGEVVQIVINALAKNDYPYPDAGIETTFNFASPSNKASTGPLQQFVRLVKGPVFRKMIDHRKSEFSKVVLQGKDAYRIAHITTKDSQIVHFVFRLRLQEKGEYKGMWLTEAVWPLTDPEYKVFEI